MLFKDVPLDYNCDYLKDFFFFLESHKFLLHFG